MGLPLQINAKASTLIVWRSFGEEFIYWARVDNNKDTDYLSKAFPLNVNSL